MPRYCLVCGQLVPEVSDCVQSHSERFNCPVCGDYCLGERAHQQLGEIAYSGRTPKPNVADNHHLLSAVIRERFERAGKHEVFIPDFDEVRAAAIPLNDPFEAVDRILLYVAQSAPRVGDEVQLVPKHDYPVGFARDAMEFENLIGLGVQVGFLEVQESLQARPSPDGLRRLAQLRIRAVDPDSAFVAMSFSEELQEVYKRGIEPALLSTGFRSIRADRIEHNGKIDDRIVADIRRSFLVVADFTGHRHNVYFEAAFALGLGRHVIWMCRDSDINEAHFDTRQYNHVVWRDATDLRERLRNRIEATIPRSRTAQMNGREDR